MCTTNRTTEIQSTANHHSHSVNSELIFFRFESLFVAYFASSVRSLSSSSVSVCVPATGKASEWFIVCVRVCAPAPQNKHIKCECILFYENRNREISHPPRHDTQWQNASRVLDRRVQQRPALAAPTKYCRQRWVTFDITTSRTARCISPTTRAKRA